MEIERNNLMSELKIVFQHVFNREFENFNDSLNASMVVEWDSMSHLTLITEIEKKFQIKFNIAELIRMKNLGDMVDIILSK